MKKIVTMQDISCVGKCSLTVALPVISAMGIETSVLPTAVLSAHTMFSNVTFHDLTDELNPIMEHWKKENFRFDAVYTGYLGSFRQLKIAEQLFDEFGQGLCIVDPCMADNGKLYTGFSPEFPKAMAALCAKADVICPNMTEASLLLGIPYREEYDEAYVKDVLKQLCALGCKAAVITGTVLHPGKIGAYAYDSVNDVYTCVETPEESTRFHGTGDLWASVFTGALVRGLSFEKAMYIACEFIRASIARTLAEENHNTYGVNFEQAIPYLLELLGD